MAESAAAPPWGRRLRRRWILAAVAAALVLLVAAGLHLLRPASLPGAEEADPSRIVIVAIGDSNTLGVAAPDPERADSYPDHLQELLGEEEHQVLNHGVDNRSLLDSADFPYVEEPAHRASQEARPDVVLIMLGTNDARAPNWDAPAYEEQLTAFVEDYQQLDSSPEVHLLTPPPALENAGGIDPAVVSEQVRPIVEDVARSTDAELIDIHALLEDRPELMGEDGIHPTAAGYELIAAEVHEALTGHDEARPDPDPDTEEAGTDG